jgi:hypothetical protein
MADREGRLEYRPKKIKVEVLPYDNCNIEKLIGQLSAKGFILPYSVNGCNYVSIINFVKHQNCHMREPESIIPAPCENDTGTMQGTIPARPLTESPILNPEIPIPGSGAEPMLRPQKLKHLESVMLLKAEYEKLVTKYGGELTDKSIEILNNYKMSSGKKYKSDYHTLIQWPMEKAREANGNGTIPRTGGQRYGRPGDTPLPYDSQRKLDAIERELERREALKKPSDIPDAVDGQGHPGG